MNAGVELHFILYGVLAVFFLKDMGYMLFTIALTMVNYFVLSVLLKDFIYEVKEENRLLYFFNHLLALGFIFYGLFLVKKENTVYQFNILAKQQSLEEQNSKIEAQHEEISTKAIQLEKQKEELEKKLWKAIKSDRTLMLGLDGVEDGHTRPMTALLEHDGRGPLWIFTATDNRLAQQTLSPQRAIATFASMGHDVFASLQGMLVRDDDRGVIDRLWNPFVAAWYEGGKDDPKLALLRFDAEHAEIWLNESNLLAGVKLLLGVDPKDDYKDKVAKVALS
jgi:general stress protein 26